MSGGTGYGDEIAQLQADAKSETTQNTMQRPELPEGKPRGGYSNLESFSGYSLPHLYRHLFGRKYALTLPKEAAQGETKTRPSEGLRFGCIVASEVTGQTVAAEALVKTLRAFERVENKHVKRPEVS